MPCLLFFYPKTERARRNLKLSAVKSKTLLFKSRCESSAAIFIGIMLALTVSI